MVKYESLALFIGIGLGKTIITLIAIRRLIQLGVVKRVLIVAPIKVMENVWQQEAASWEYVNDLTFTILHGTKKDKLFNKKTDAENTPLPKNKNAPKR